MTLYNNSIISFYCQPWSYTFCHMERKNRLLYNSSLFVHDGWCLHSPSQILERIKKERLSSQTLTIPLPACRLLYFHQWKLIWCLYRSFLWLKTKRSTHCTCLLIIFLLLAEAGDQACHIYIIDAEAWWNNHFIAEETTFETKYDIRFWCVPNRSLPNKDSVGNKFYFLSYECWWILFFRNMVIATPPNNWIPGAIF